MDSKTLTNNNIDNIQQYCKGCEKNLPTSFFVTNENFYRTCSVCRVQNKEVHQRKSIYKQQLNNPNANIANQTPIELIELHNFGDFMSEIFNIFENENKENTENLKFEFSCIVNTVTLEGDFKEKANYIIKEICDVDDYTWM